MLRIHYAPTLATKTLICDQILQEKEWTEKESKIYNRQSPQVHHLYFHERLHTYIYIYVCVCVSSMLRFSTKVGTSTPVTYKGISKLSELQAANRLNHAKFLLKYSHTFEFLLL